MEYLETYDDHGNPTGRSERRDSIHARGLWHRTVHVWIFTASGCVLLQKRSRSKDSHPGLWDTSAAGHIEPGESPIEAARREAKEELGLEIQGDTLLFLGVKMLTLVSQEGRFIDREITHVYLCNWEGPIGSLSIDEGELEAVTFVDTARLRCDRRGLVPHGSGYYRWIVDEIEKRTHPGPEVNPE
jgi:isopentenyl-diphosphate delta-isomerase